MDLKAPSRMTCWSRLLRRGARIFASGADIGITPLHLKIFAKKEGKPNLFIMSQGSSFLATPGLEDAIPSGLALAISAPGPQVLKPDHTNNTAGMSSGRLPRGSPKRPRE